MMRVRMNCLEVFLRKPRRDKVYWHIGARMYVRRENEFAPTLTG